MHRTNAPTGIRAYSTPSFEVVSWTPSSLSCVQRCALLSALSHRHIMGFPTITKMTVSLCLAAEESDFTSLEGSVKTASPRE